MCIFKASYVGRDKAPLKFGEVYGVERSVVKGDGKVVLLIEGIDGEYDKSLFQKLENKGFHYLINEAAPRVGSNMRLVKRKNDMAEVLTGRVKLVEKSMIPGVYMAYTEKAVYEVAPMG